MGKLAGTLTIKNLVVNAQGFEQLREDDATHRVDGICTYAELTLTNGFHIGQSQLEYRLYMTLIQRIVNSHMSQFFYRCIVKGFSLSNTKHLCSVGRRQELTLAIQQFQGVPLGGIVTGGYDDAAVGLVPANGQLGGWCRSQADVDDLVTHTDKCATDNVTHHGSADAAIAADHDFRSVRSILSVRSIRNSPSNECGVCRRKLHDVKRIERVARRSADGTTNTRD